MQKLFRIAARYKREAAVAAASHLNAPSTQPVLATSHLQYKMPRAKPHKPLGIEDVLKNNLEWSKAMHASDPEFFSSLAHQQAPEYLWIGCSDSRVPANQILGLAPGEVFVQRNVGNQATHKDINCMSCVEYAVNVLKVKHIIICGHYNCGAVRAALTLPAKTSGLVNLWISDIRDVRNANETQLRELDAHDQLDRLCELNVIRQLFNVCTSPIVQAAWDRKQDLSVHGLVYSVSDGLLRELSPSITNMSDLDKYEASVEEENAAEAAQDAADAKTAATAATALTVDVAADGSGKPQDQQLVAEDNAVAGGDAAKPRLVRRSNTMKRLAKGFFHSMSTHLYFERTSVGADCSTPKAASPQPKVVFPDPPAAAAAAAASPPTAADGDAKADINPTASQ
ncbi:hypothetical protein WJX72_008004 [[Myrmecia] bisecta]|uniref:Carbonic anhydrase n=1 Tax=[Myrmecia] bisecta TaxID=41462 RepID=A0AAW1PXN7_9CHLO